VFLEAAEVEVKAKKATLQDVHRYNLAMNHLIDSYSGAIRLEKGLILKGGQTSEELVQLIGPRPSGSFWKNTWYTDIRMETEFGALVMALFFKSDALVMFQASITSSYGTTGSMIKSKNDKLMIDDLGRPHEEKPYKPSLIEGFMLKAHAQAWHDSAKELTWKLPFGTVTSTVEPRDGSSVFRVRWK
jgi:hypothetical protein